MKRKFIKKVEKYFDGKLEEEEAVLLFAKIYSNPKLAEDYKILSTLNEMWFELEALSLIEDARLNYRKNHPEEFRNLDGLLN